MSRVHIGISGWSYPTWRGVFYPRGLPAGEELRFATRQLDSVEVNASFYSLLKPRNFLRWREETPSDFVLAVKGSRSITHLKRLSDVRSDLANFFASGVLALEEKLGPILWQLPPSMRFDGERLASFLQLLPRTSAEAVALAREHEPWLASRVYLRTGANRPLRHAIEVRHSSFRTPEFMQLLRRERTALVIADTAGQFPDFDEVTADFVYVRLHGETKLYESGYTEASLERWAERIRAWQSEGRSSATNGQTSSVEQELSAGREVYVYFDNTARIRAPFDARVLRAMVRGESVPEVPSDLAADGAPARVVWPAWSERESSGATQRKLPWG